MPRRIRRKFRNHSGPHFGGGFAGAPGGKARAVVYAANVMSSVTRQSRRGTAFAEWVADSNHILNMGLTEEESSDWVDIMNPQAPTRDVWQTMQKAVCAAADTHRPEAEVIPVLLQLCKAMSLDSIDAEILQLFIDYSTCRVTGELWNRLSDSEGENCSLRLDPRFVGMMLNRSEEEVAERLSVGSALRESGLIRFDQNSGVTVLPRLSFTVRQPLIDGIDVKSALMGPQRTTNLCLEDFAHMGDDVHHTMKVLRGALQLRSRGCVICIYGPPGTGKTQLAVTLASALGVPLHSVGETDEEGREPNRDDRLAELQIAQRLLSNAAPSLLLVDEAEDLFGDGNDLMLRLFGARRSIGSKAYIHKLLETCNAPIILTANSLNAFGPAVIRRMTVCLEVRVPPVQVRTRMWEIAAAENCIEVETKELAVLARQIPAAPAVAASAMKAARLAGGNPETISWALNGVVKAINGGKTPIVPAMPPEFDLDLVNADIDLVALADSLCRSNAPKNWGMLLSGPSGAGKTVFARHLADRLGMEVVAKRASDIFGKYVGETEKNIAAAFAEAIDTHAVLVFDECDSLIQDRGGAHRNWEVSQVNEFLIGLETHSLPVVCTTNLLSRVDKAVMRRFLIKAEFKPLTRDQTVIAFQKFFNTEAPSALSQLDKLTPADFSVARRMAELHGKLDDSRFLISLLEKEQVAKHGIKKEAIGFLH